MLKRKFFDPSTPYRAAVYLRMSSELQNERSPDQQRQEIERRIKLLGCPWSIVATYRDNATSGRLLRKRQDYQRMLRDIRSGAVVVDLILVDTLERFGRVEALPVIRKELFERHGVLVLTADSNFADPTSVAGRALGFVQAVCATEHGEKLAHNVGRGKWDSALLKHWIGGNAPFGFMLKSIMKLVDGREEVDYRVLVPNPRTSWIIVLLFNTAAKTGWGTTRLAQVLTAHSDIPDEYKPFQPETVGYWLDSQIYYGDLFYGKNSTGLIGEQRVVEANSLEEILHVANFCEPLITRQLWEEVQGLRQNRRNRAAASRARRGIPNEKQIVPPAPGLTIGYLLSGLVFCKECGLRMIATPSSGYTTKDGQVRKYTSYVCPGYKAGHCSNNMFVSEEWLRTVVVSAISKRLFPGI